MLIFEVYMPTLMGSTDEMGTLIASFKTTSNTPFKSQVQYTNTQKSQIPNLRPSLHVHPNQLRMFSRAPLLIRKAQIAVCDEPALIV